MKRIHKALNNIIECRKLYRKAVCGEIGMIQFVSFCETAVIFGDCGKIETYVIDQSYLSLIRRNIPQMVLKRAS